MNLTAEKPMTHWRPVLAMALMQGAIVMCWVVYRMYLPGLLGDFGFPKGAALVILAIEGFLAVLIEPLFGSLSDRYKTLLGIKAPFVTIGVLLTAVLMTLTPAMIFFGRPDSFVRWLFVAVLLIWAMAMAMFRSPMLARLGEFACQRDWPYAASVLTLVGTIAGTLALPTSQQIVKSMGAWPAFTLSSIVLLLSATLLHKAQPPQVSLPTIADMTASRSSQKNLVLVALTGMTITLGIILTRQLIGLVGKEQTPALMTLFLVVQLITVLPIGWGANRWGSLPTMIGGLGLLGVGFFVLLAPLGIAKSAAMILLGLGMSAVGVGDDSLCAEKWFHLTVVVWALAFILVVPLSRGAMFNVYMSNAGQLPFSGGFLIGLLSLLIAIVALWISRSRLA